MRDVHSYVRCSTGKQADAHSLDMQRDAIASYCAMRELAINREYKDAAETSKTELGNRAQGKFLVEHIETGRVKEVVVWKLNRLFRNMMEALTTIVEWDKKCVHLHILDMGGQLIDTNTAIGKIMVAVMAGAAEIERENISENTAAALQYCKRAGKVYTRNVYGYDNVGGVLTPNMSEQTVIDMMRSLRHHGESYGGIAIVLNGRGIPGKRGGKWYAKTVSNILNNELHSEQKE